MRNDFNRAPGIKPHKRADFLNSEQDNSKQYYAENIVNNHRINSQENEHKKYQDMISKSASIAKSRDNSGTVFGQRVVGI